MKLKLKLFEGSWEKYLFVSFVFIFVLLIIMSRFGHAEPYVVPFVQDYAVNVTASNGSLLLMFPNATYNYTLSNVSQDLTFPVSFSRNVTLFNVTITPEDNLSCDVVFRDAIANATGYWENVTRAQLVPSVEQYNGLLALRQNDSAQCVVAQNILSNEIINWRVRLNASETNFRYAVEAKDTIIENERGEKRTSNIIVGVLAVMNFVWLLMILTGQTPKQWWDNFIHQTDTSPLSADLKTPKGKGGAK